MSIIYNGKDSLRDFELYVASKEIPSPVRKSVTDTVPYMTGLWDFSQDEYEAITVKYTFDVIGENKKELNQQKSRLLAWINGKADNLIDTDLSLGYFKVYSTKASWAEEDCAATLTAEFLCYPFLLNDYSESVALSSTMQYVYINAKYKDVTPIITVTGGTAYIKIFTDDSSKAVSYTVQSGTRTDLFTIKSGETSKTRLYGTGTIVITWRTEEFA